MEKWFKFYSADYLLDGKIRSLSASERSCLITILCLSDTSDIPGVIKRLSEFDLLVMSGIEHTSDEWNKTIKVIDKLSDLGVIKRNDNGSVEVINFRKRQGTALSAYERVKKYRRKRNDNEMKRLITDDNADDNSRIEENRKEEKKREREKGANAPQTNFFSNPEKQQQEKDRLIKSGFEENTVYLEITKFISYWTEPNKTGKQRWQAEKFFDPKRRLNTWFSRIK